MNEWSADLAIGKTAGWPSGCVKAAGDQTAGRGGFRYGRWLVRRSSRLVILAEFLTTAGSNDFYQSPDEQTFQLQRTAG